MKTSRLDRSRWKGTAAGVRHGAAGLLAAWATLLLPQVAAAQGAGPGAEDPADTFTDETTTLRVEVPVEVTLDGEPVRGLTAENFELVDAGDRQEILSVDVVDLTTVALAEGPERVDALPVVARRHFLLLFDFSFSKPASIERARQAALDLVDGSLHPADMVAVATYALNQGVRIRLAFTPDRDQVRLALRTLGQSETTQGRSDPLKLFLSEPDRAIDSDLGGFSGGGNQRQDMVAETARQLQAMADKAQAAQGRREVSSMARSLGELGSLLRTVEGRKHVVYFSEGFDGNLLTGATDQARRDELVRTTQTGSIVDFATLDSDEYFGSSETLGVMDRMAEEFRRSDSTVHTVDIGGLRAGGGVGSAAGSGKDGLFMMAGSTGGDFYENWNDLGGAMERMLEKTSVTYVLSYRPAEVKPNGKYRKLKVKLKGLPRKAEIVHRPGWFAPDADALQGTAAQLDLAQRLWDGSQGGAIRARVLAAPLETDDPHLGDKSYVALLVEVDGRELLRTPKEPRDEGRKKKKRRKKGESTSRAADGTRAEIFVYALDLDGKVVDFFSQSVGIDLQGAGGVLAERGLKLYAPLLLDPGPHVLRVLVRNSRTGASGLRVSRVEVPPAGASPRVLPPLFPEPVDAWVLVRGRRQDLAGEAEPPYPFFHGSTIYIPAVQPQLVPGQVLPVFLAGYGVDQVRGLDAEVLDAWGRSAAIPRWRLDDRMQQGEDGLQRYVAAFEVPELGPGSYTLRLKLRNGEGDETPPGEVSFEVPYDGARLRNRLLTLDSPPDFGPAPAPGARAEAVDAMASTRLAREPENDARDALEQAQVEARYRELVERLAAVGAEGSDLEQLVAEVGALEVAAVGDQPERRVARLDRTQVRVAEELAGRDPESLVPLLLLHLDLFLHHKEMRRPFLVVHSESMVEELAKTYARLGGSEGSRVVAARALASLGGHLEAAGRFSGMRYFEQSLGLDPSNEAALLGLAAFYEKRGGPYEQVVGYLEDLVERRPGSREGRLRLGINLLRTLTEPGVVDRAARKASATEHLQFLLDGDEADWIYSLAAQEATRFHLAEGAADRASAVIDGALERRPDDQKLMLLKTFLLDRARRSSSAGRVADGLVSGAAAGDVSTAARELYNRWPREALDADRRALREEAARRLDVLRAEGEE